MARRKRTPPQPTVPLQTDIRDLVQLIAAPARPQVERLERPPAEVPDSPPPDTLQIVPLEDHGASATTLASPSAGTNVDVGESRNGSVSDVASSAAETDPDTELPSVRCPNCAGTGQLPNKKQWYTPGREANPCPVCAPYGPFGLVPPVVAIECTLADKVDAREKIVRDKINGVANTLDWLLKDTPVKCDHCDGTGRWPNKRFGNTAARSRVCFHCNGTGVHR